MKIPQPTTIDFETKPIRARPDYPPKPVGVSIKYWGKKPTYYAFGHPTENTCSFEDAKRALKAAYKTPDGILCHNGKFDTDVAETFFDLPLPTSLKIHETMFLLFLNDPHSLQLKLKPAAQKYLNMPPEEQDAVREWAIGAGHMKRSQKNAGEYIWLAPGKSVVGPYANGDVIRTEGLFKFLYPIIVERGMLEAYQREQRLMPYLLKNEREGMRADIQRLETDHEMYTKANAMVEAWIRKRLKAPGLNINSDRELAAALMNANAVSEWTFTESGQASVSKKNLLIEHFADKELAFALGYHSRLGTCMGTFMEPWLAMARENKGWIHTTWRQVKGSGGDGDGGARSNRLQSSPNFQNIPKSFYDKGDGYQHPTKIKGLPELPLMRAYILPDSPKHWLGRRDYNQQELRILAHFEDGDLLAAYLANPRLDVHTYVRGKIKELAGLDLERGPVKILNFGMLYGMGMGKLAARIRQDVGTARKLKSAQMMALSGVKELDADIKARGRNGEAIRTWGGREYFCEEPMIINGRRQTFEYKLLNYLIQGSAADCTKEALIRYGDLHSEDSRFMLTVHDEIDISAPKGLFKKEMLRLRECMMSVEFDLPMLSDAEFGPRWSELDDLLEPSPL